MQRYRKAIGATRGGQTTLTCRVSDLPRLRRLLCGSVALLDRRSRPSSKEGRSASLQDLSLPTTAAPYLYLASTSTVVSVPPPSDKPKIPGRYMSSAYSAGTTNSPGVTTRAR